jgi:hypothetical protein
MSYCQDGTAYRYSDRAVGDVQQPAGDDEAVNIGWLDGSMPFDTGQVPAAFVERLVELCGQYGVHRTRGWHACTLCPPDAAYPTMVHTATGAYPVGSAEIRVEGLDGIRYAAPNMIVHYVLEHHYRPPHVFIAAVLQTSSDQPSRGAVGEPGG